jgi:peroxiredoxin Q/BCP
MRSSPRLRPALLASALVLGLAGPAAAQTSAQSAPPARPAMPAAAATEPATAAPAVGSPAPEFTLPTVRANGAVAPVSLAALRGKVVVLAFYPKDRTSGCTAELEKFRDEYTALFGPKAGTDVVVVPTSADALDSHAAWAGEARFPFALASDSGLVVAERYGSRRPAASTPNRTVFVIDRAGRVAYRDLRFNALSEDAYRQLAAAVRRVAGA